MFPAWLPNWASFAFTASRSGPPHRPAWGSWAHGRSFLLPGNPVSCLCAFDLFVSRALRRLGGFSTTSWYAQRRLPLARKIASLAGRVDYVRVRLDDQGRLEPLAIRGASILTSTTRAVGFVLVPKDLEGYAEGEIVTVHLYDADAV